MSLRRAEHLERLGSELDAIVRRAFELEEKYAAQLELLHPEQVHGGRNLLHYLALRHGDLLELQDELARLGLSSLGSSEAHVLATIQAVQRAIRHLRGEPGRGARPRVTVRQGREAIRKKTTALLGGKRKGSSVRIMVTFPDEAADDYALVLGLVKAGMNCARINCAHGGPAEWERMIANVHRARAATGRACKIFMDLSGPKIRTGSLAPGPEVLKINPPRDAWGRVTEPAIVQLVPERSPSDTPPGGQVPISPTLFSELKWGDRLEFRDTRDQRSCLEITDVAEGRVQASCSTRAFLRSGLTLIHRNGQGASLGEGAVGRLPGLPTRLTLRIGDTLIIHKDPRPGENAQPAVPGLEARPAHVSCQVPEVIDFVQVGDPLVLDDGKVRGVVREVRPDEIVVEVTHAAPGGTGLKAYKGINLPKTRLGIFGLTDKDREDLSFVVRHADGVNVSFVNHPDDVEDLIDELEAQGGEHLGVVLKIETVMGVRHLPGILLAAMEWPRLGVMIARGDLAAEVGWTQLARAQEEILWVCEAAHVPVIWATEVLARLAKKGLPTRSEISDVVMAERAECVMLNKGPHITTAIRALDSILESMQPYQRKKTTLLPSLTLEMPDPAEIGRPIGDRQGRWTPD